MSVMSEVVFLLTSNEIPRAEAEKNAVAFLWTNLIFLPYFEVNLNTIHKKSLRSNCNDVHPFMCLALMYKDQY